MSSSMLIHRSRMGSMRPLCDEKLGARISTSGVMLTCPRCIELSREPTHAEKLAVLRASITKALAKAK